MLKNIIAFIVASCLFIIFFIFIGKEKDKSENKIRSFVCQDFQSSCEITLGNQLYSVRFDRKTLYTEETTNMIIEPINPNNMVLNEATTLLAENKYAIAGVAEGITMYMGKIPLIFKQAPEQPHRYQTTLAFGSCTEEKMVWRLWLGQSEKSSLMTLDKNTLNNKNFLDVTVIKN